MSFYKKSLWLEGENFDISPNATKQGGGAYEVSPQRKGGGGKF